ncbi:MAG: Dynamin-related GTPase protein [Paramarteilia canceri]
MEISIINEVQLLLARAGKKLIDLPMIIAVGSQSSGKSSVIERMIGREFLPKGSGIVTKRPLIIQMNHVTSGKGIIIFAIYNIYKESYEFAHKSGHIFYSTSDVMNEIVAETERVCGTDRSAVSEIPISLRVRSPNVVNLTVVDLPGLTSIAVSGQDESIVKKIHAMVHKFASSQNSVILSVMPANQDLANSAALKLAKAVDPEGLRTIGVITKIDLMDSGTDCLDILQNKVYTLKLGFIGVVNRNQKQIASKMDYNKSLELEANFFQSHPMY